VFTVLWRCLSSPTWSCVNCNSSILSYGFVGVPYKLAGRNVASTSAAKDGTTSVIATATVRSPKPRPHRRREWERDGRQSRTDRNRVDCQSFNYCRRRSSTLVVLVQSMLLSSPGAVVQTYRTSFIAMLESQVSQPRRANVDGSVAVTSRTEQQSERMLPCYLLWTWYDMIFMHINCILHCVECWLFVEQHCAFACFY